MMEYSFEQGMKRLDEIRFLLDREETPLEDLIALYKEGIKISKELENRLQATETEIFKLEGESDE